MSHERRRPGRNSLITGIAALALALVGGGALVFTGALSPASAAPVNGLEADDQLFGDPNGGTAFDDRDALPAEFYDGQPVVRSLTVRSGERVDQVELTINRTATFGNQRSLTHGGDGGKAQTVELSTAGRTIKSITATSEKENSRITSMKFTFSDGKELLAGHESGKTVTFAAPAGQQIVGLRGRSGDNIDQMGAVYAQVQCDDTPDNKIPCE